MNGCELTSRPLLNPNHRPAPAPSFRCDPYLSHILCFNLNYDLTLKAVFKVYPTLTIAHGPILVSPGTLGFWAQEGAVGAMEV